MIINRRNDSYSPFGKSPRDSNATKASISSDQSLMLFLSLNMIYDHKSPVKFHTMVLKHVSIAGSECCHYFGSQKFSRLKLSLLLFADKSAGDQ